MYWKMNFPNSKYGFNFNLNKSNNITEFSSKFRLGRFFRWNLPLYFIVEWFFWIDGNFFENILTVSNDSIITLMQKSCLCRRLPSPSKHKQQAEQISYYAKQDTDYLRKDSFVNVIKLPFFSQLNFLMQYGYAKYYKKKKKSNVLILLISMKFCKFSRA